MQVAVLALSVVVTVIIALPALTAVILPASSTVTTPVSDDAQFTVLSVASDGFTVASKVSEFPIVNTSDVLFKTTSVTAILFVLVGVVLARTIKGSSKSRNKK